LHSSFRRDIFHWDLSLVLGLEEEFEDRQDTSHDIGVEILRVVKHYGASIETMMESA
jgi:hypothetical protein